MLFHGQFGSSVGFCERVASLLSSVSVISIRNVSSFYEFKCTAAIPRTTLSCERTSRPVLGDKRCDQPDGCSSPVSENVTPNPAADTRDPVSQLPYARA